MAYALWFRGIERLPVAQVSVLGLLSPIVATAAGFVVLGQTLTAAQLGGAALVLTAVWRGQRSAGAPEPHPAGAPVDLDPLGPEPAGVVGLVAGHEAAGGGHDAPPRLVAV